VRSLPLRHTACLIALVPSNLRLMAAAALAFVGLLRFQLDRRNNFSEAPWISARLSTRLERGRARSELPLPPAFAPDEEFEISAPSDARLFACASDVAALAPRDCAERRCTYKLVARHAASRRLTAQVNAVGQYGFELVQPTSFGQVRERVSWRVLP
jgi:hypothetical protein